ncbi:MAG: VOC family protein [Saprospiraceae bacterium]|nr:VOC family protein [Saprospiraceae bacterium]
MLKEISPKLPMRNKEITKEFYVNKLGFEVWGNADFEGYLMLKKDSIQMHFFSHPDLNPYETYGQVYIRTGDIDAFYQLLLDNNVKIQGKIENKPWGQREFSLIDPDHNLLTFGQELV